MEFTVTKTVEEKIYIDLSTPLFRKYMDGGMCYRISLTSENKVQICSVVTSLSLQPSIGIMYACNDLEDMVQCKNKYNEINAEQFQDEVNLAMKLMRL